MDRFWPTELSLAPDSDDIEVAWTDFADLPMTDPFFKATMERAGKLAWTSGGFRTGWDILKRVAEVSDTMPFAGAVFHMARTGSTLIHRLLSRTGMVLSVSEPPIVENALKLTSSWPPDERGRVLRTLFQVYGRPRRPNDRKLVVKMSDAMPNIRLPMFRAAFPDTPWIFVYREPAEVIVSMMRKPTGNLENWYRNRRLTAQRLGIPELADAGMWPEEFVARTLQRFCRGAIQAGRATAPGRFLAVSYDRLPDAVIETIAPHFGIELSAQDRELVMREAKYSSKKAGREEFSSDRESKRDEVTPFIRDLAHRFVQPELEELRGLPQG